MSGNVNPPRAIARLGTSGGPFCQAAHAGANQVNPASSARSPVRRGRGPRQITRPAAIRASPAHKVSAAPAAERPAYVVDRPGPSATASAPAAATSPASPAARRAGAARREGTARAGREGTASRGHRRSITRLWHRCRRMFPCWPQSRAEGSPDAAGLRGRLQSMTTFGTLGGTMERMTSSLAAAAVVAGLAILGAGCAANPAAPAGGHPSSAAAASPALPNPFTILARYSAKSLGLDHPGALAIAPDGNLYVTDLSQRVQVFTSQGRFIRQFGSYGSGKGQFFFPADLVVDGSGNVYVTDDQSQTLAKFSPAGKVIWQIGGSASSDQDLLGHQHLASIDAHGRLVMVNDDQGRVLYVNPSGHKVDAFSPDSSSFTGGNVCEVTVDAAGDTYLSGCGPAPPSPTLVYDRAHRLIAKWPGSTYKLLRSPAFGPNGEVFALATDGSILRLRITLPAG